MPDYEEITRKQLWGWIAIVKCGSTLIEHCRFQLEYIDSTKPLPERYHWQPPFPRDHYVEKHDSAVASHDRSVAYLEKFLGWVPDITEALKWRREQRERMNDDQI